MTARLRKIAALPDTEFLLVTEEDPITFYTLLLALWINRNRVILPTRDFFADPGSIPYYRYTVSCPYNEVVVKPNSNFKIQAKLYIRNILV